MESAVCLVVAQERPAGPRGHDSCVVLIKRGQHFNAARRSSHVHPLHDSELDVVRTLDGTFKAHLHLAACGIFQQAKREIVRKNEPISVEEVHVAVVN